MAFLDDLALAHQQKEGYYPGSVAYTHNNPGNIRAAEGRYVQFKSYTAGFNALKRDVEAKIMDHSMAMNRYYEEHNIHYEQATFQDYINVYAPVGDHNNPQKYCADLCNQLKKYNVSPQTPLFDLARLITGEITQIPTQDSSSDSKSLEQRLNSAENALKWAKGDRANLLTRLIRRIKKILSIS